MGDKTRQFNAR